MFQLKDDAKRTAILNEAGNILIMGGPGSGKTTIALFKAKSIVETGMLKPGQKVLFLSFARATISRIEEHAGALISKETKKHIEINTYHGFIWNILKNHGYLLNTHPIKLWSPHEAATKLAGVPADQQNVVKQRIFDSEGLVHFDLFAQLCNKLLSTSCPLRRIISDTYPVIILDEFQDTNLDEWELIKTLGKDSKLIALADPDQRIFDFRGADPKRVTHFLEEYNPPVYDFGKENNRSNGTDIAQYGNDLLSGNNRGKPYCNVKVVYYPFRKKPFSHVSLKYSVLSAIQRLNQNSPNDWSLAVLVPTNALVMEVSDTLQRVQTAKNGQKLPSIPHEVAIETSGPSLAAVFLATLLEENRNANSVITALINHISGRRGNKPATKDDVAVATALEKYIGSGKITGKKRLEIIDDCNLLIEEADKGFFSGNIIADWKRLTDLINSRNSDYLKRIASDLRYLRLLQRGSQLYASLDELWRSSHSYNGAVNAVSEALMQEHFSLSTKSWDGVNVMTIHKAKGKEFDEVIIYEGWYQNRFVSKPERLDQARLNLRVAVTRARMRSTILTPEVDPCPLL